MPKTVKVKAAITATLHDGKNMIVLTKGKTVPVAESSLEFLRSRDAIVEKKLPQLDHDGDGEPGGSKTAEGDDLAPLRAEYLEVFGKKAFNGWDADTLREKIAEAQAASGDNPGDDADADMAGSDDSDAEADSEAHQGDADDEAPAA